ncbi:myb family transcription factor PHL8-like [Arachis duranensis]|uniref:Myb family transcription factor PHL8-like n=1 Tax=Arachis duranensis TaxID=130453 RepID=A0A6P4CZB9_ARADU|nr:myb family transcription factor PHL8-like [Arachis duranensis]
MENVQNSIQLVLSTDAKPSLKWTPELHQRFIEAINQLGGSENCRELKNSEGPCSSREESIGTQNEMTESMQIAEALQMQMEVQKKLDEQIEVQRHLKLKIEAQVKYLQS